MNKIFVEKNKIYQIDLSAAINAFDDLHEKYKSISNLTSDVDFIAETDDEILLIEYKNTDVKNANPDALKEKMTKFGEYCDSIAKKYYWSAFYILACRKEKPINFIFIIEASFLDRVMKKRMLASIKKRLPYELQELPEISVNLINDFKILSIKEWNEQYSMFPLTAVI